MRLFSLGSAFCLSSCFLVAACIDRLDQPLDQRTNLIVVDGTITDLPEAQLVLINRAQTDSVTGRFGFKAVTKAVVEVIVDSSQIVACHETLDGHYLEISEA